MGWFDDAKNWASEAADAVGDTVSAAASSVTHAVTHPVETYNKASAVVSEAATATAEYVAERGVLGTLEDGARGIGFAAQGAASGLGSGIASIGDLAVNVGYNWTARHAINAFRDEPLESYDSNLAGKAGAALRIFEPKNDFERAMMAGGQVVGEVGAFVALTVATAGVGGAAIGATAAAARGTTVATRTVSALTTSAETLASGGRVAQTFAKAAQGSANLLTNGNTLQTASQAANATARMLNPLANNTALGLEVGLGTYKAGEIFNQDKANDQAASQILADKIEADSEASIEKDNFVQAKDELLQLEMSDIEATLNQFENGEIELTEAQYNAQIARVQELIQADSDLAELNSNDITPEREAELREKLNETLPEQDKQAALAEDQISLDDIQGASIVRMQDDASLSAQTNTERPTLETKLETTLNV